jgi:hypothetical protein
MVQLSATRCSCIAILWVSILSFAAIPFVLLLKECLCCLFLYDLFGKLLDTPSYVCIYIIHTHINIWQLRYPWDKLTQNQVLRSTDCITWSACVTWWCIWLLWGMRLVPLSFEFLNPSNRPRVLISCDSPYTRLVGCRAWWVYLYENSHLILRQTGDLQVFSNGRVG